MDVKKTVDEWVLEYSVKNQLNTVSGAAISRLDDMISALELPDVQLACCTLQDIINNWTSLSDPVILEVALELLDFIYASFPEAVTFKLYSKLVVGLKMLILLHMLKNKDKDCLKKLMKHFPRCGPKYPGVCPQQLSHLHIVHGNFRKFYLPLLANSRQAEAYFRAEFAEEYGNEFYDALQKMCSWFVEKIQCKFPKPMLTKVMESPDILKEFQNSPDIQILMDTLHDKTSLTSADLQELLTMVDPVCTQDRIQVPDTFSLSSRRFRCQCEDEDVNTNSYRSNNQNYSCCMHVHYSENSTGYLSQDISNSKQLNDSLCCSFSERSVSRTATNRPASNQISPTQKTTKTQKSPDTSRKISRNVRSTLDIDKESDSVSTKKTSLLSIEEKLADRKGLSKDLFDCVVSHSPLENTLDDQDSRHESEQRDSRNVSAEDIVPILSHEDMSGEGRSISDIDQFSEDTEEIEDIDQFADDTEDHTQELTFNSSSGDISSQQYHVPDITQHQRQISTPLCIVKLYKTQVFQKHNIYC
ncbi:uncharacterized protein LOC111134367 isoform X3 [Crassostrea virginica]